MRVKPIKKDPEYAEFIALHRKMIETHEFISSLDIRQEAALRDLLLTDPMQSGEKMFTLMAWATGATAEELMQMKWKDIVALPDSAHSYIQILCIGTPGCRLVPLGSLLCQFLRTRLLSIDKKYEAKVNTRNEAEKFSVKELYICCDGENDARPCSFENVQKITRDILMQAGIKQDALRYLELYRKCELPPSERARETMTEIFLFRRTYGTVCNAFGITSEEVSYLMKLPYPNMSAETRMKKYNCIPSDALGTIADKHSLRPFFNPLPEWYIKKQFTDDVYDDRYLLQRLYDAYSKYL